VPEAAFRRTRLASLRAVDELLAIGEERRPRGRGSWEVDELLVGDAAIAALAARQQGIVTTRQLAAAGLGRNGVAHRVAKGRLIPLHRGVYQVGPVAGPYAREMAAVLATGGALSHHSAAALWGFRPPHDGDIHVTTRRPARSRRGVRTHRSASLEAAVHLGLPLTTVPRTLHDLAPLLPQHELDRAVEEAVIRGMAHPDQLTTRPALRRAVIPEPRLTKSKAERRLLRLIRAARLPLPRTNVMVAGWEVDAVWPQNRLVVEVDGYAYHGNRAAFERDRRKDAALTAAGYRVVRITWRQLEDEPHAVVALIARLTATKSAG
jgi:very-short-patch-repair endonuclease